MKLNCEFFYGYEADQFKFYRVPQILVADKRFKNVSYGAKLLYGVLLDRMGLSILNKWYDDKNCAFIIYSINEVIESLSCSRGTAVKFMSELENIGLIERKKRDQSNGYSFSQLSEIASNAIFQYRDMYLRPEFYAQNEGYVRSIISEVLKEYKLGRMDYDEAKKRAYEKIYQSVDASFDYDIEFAKDTCYRNIPSVDNSLFSIARKLILAERTPV